MTVKERLIEEVKMLSDEEATRILQILRNQKAAPPLSGERADRVRAGLGKFAFVRTSSEEFDRRQSRELDLEEAREASWRAGSPVAGLGERL